LSNNKITTKYFDNITTTYFELSNNQIFVVTYKTNKMVYFRVPAKIELFYMRAPQRQGFLIKKNF